ncbi:transposase IS200 like protein [Clostridium tepidiprofundi DSM 19306]|uniref:Transposase IS200 like protein n=1 Tax=Clostridium tepidiprofundi DSM 19306 TaxID=1121338 RepID=A0A151AVT6_9CLOT|nr:transposase [Clostridium tepidiprofundi]KYH31774.1 transposase IS200 like protein [Clostridium tepidiprofundi DSM 19306]
MPRKTRFKIVNGIYHIMLRSLSDFLLFRNDKDKKVFLNIIKKYQIKYNFKVYAYCIMSNHVHLLIDSNGADISQFMHSINQSYAQYYNKTYGRRGHVFQDRFKSKIVDTNSYLFVLSAYIHRNPKDIKKYKNHIEDYKYSSLGVYLGLREDSFGILDEDYVMQMFDKDVEKARKAYLFLVYNCNDKTLKKSSEFKNEKTEYKSERHVIDRNFDHEEILDFVSKYTGVPKWQIILKSNRHITKVKALYILMLKCLCNYRDKDICKLIGNITQSRISALCAIGIEIVLHDVKYKNIIYDFITLKAS